MKGNLHYRYTDSEINKILKGLTIVVDGREKGNKEIIRYFDEKKIHYVSGVLKTGDYGAFIKANEALGVKRDIYIPAVVERKADFSELASNLQKSTETRFENELIRSQDMAFVIMVEDQNGYEKLIKGDYFSGYKPQALLARINSFKAKYGFEITYINPVYSGNFIYYHLYYYARTMLKDGVVI